MGRTAKHNWKRLYLEYCQGRFKNITEFANKNGLHPVAVQREFRKLKNGVDGQQNKTEKQNEIWSREGKQNKIPGHQSNSSSPTGLKRSFRPICCR